MRVPRLAHMGSKKRYIYDNFIKRHKEAQSLLRENKCVRRLAVYIPLDWTENTLICSNSQGIKLSFLYVFDILSSCIDSACNTILYRGIIVHKHFKIII